MPFARSGCPHSFEIIDIDREEPSPARHSVVKSGFCQGFCLASSRESEYFFEECGLRIVGLVACRYRSAHFATKASWGSIIFSGTVNLSR